MMKYSSKIPWLILFCAAVLMVSPALADVLTTEQMSKLDCKNCHTCENPTPQNKCLRSCPSFPLDKGANAHKLSEAPDSMLLDDLSDMYEPVHFNHKRHARMTEMGGYCSTCHHYTPTDQIKPCKDCHGGVANPNNLRQPGLKGAYHRQCLGCHREWSHDTKCILCHIPVSGKAMASEVNDTTDIMGTSHPLMTEPIKRMYHTPYERGPVVTFKHKEHIVLFGLRCVDCHKKENCSYCHDLQRPANLAKTDAQIHGMCNNCHVQDRCQKCHDNKERPAFSHESTGWALTRYHNKLDCQACHPTGRKISKLSNECIACHGGWNGENFEHAVTGLELDETHYAMGCNDCHLNRQYSSKPDCSGCHDDGRTYQNMPPGKYVKKM